MQSKSNILYYYITPPLKPNTQKNITDSGVSLSRTREGGEGGGTPYDGLYGDTLSERGTFFRLDVYKRIS